MSYVEGKRKGVDWKGLGGGGGGQTKLCELFTQLHSEKELYSKYLNYLSRA